MGKMLKNILIVLSLICMIVLVVFCVELFMLNRTTGNPDGDARSTSAGAGAGDSADGQQRATDTDPSAGASPDGNAGTPGDESPPPEASRPPAGTRYELLMPPDSTRLVIYIDDEIFGYTELNDGYIYDYKGGGASSLEISLVHMPYGLDTRVEDFLDGYVGNGGTSIGSEEPIGRSSVNGVYVSGDLDGDMYEAWIHTFADAGIEDMGVAVIIHYRNDGQRSVLYAALDTMALVTK